MKALTLTQPWATLVALGEKRIETRSWPTRYRGPLAIHAAKSFPADCRDLCDTPPFREALRKHGLGASDLPRGCVIATARLVSCLETDGIRFYMHKDARMLGFDPDCITGSVALHEPDFGDYSPGRFAWFLIDIVRSPIPIPARGARQAS